MPSLELKVPPPLVALAAAILMWFASSLTEPLRLPFGFRVGGALALAFVGLSISSAGIVRFRRARTTINPHKPSAASSLVSGGVYRFTRNPMYLGLLVTLLGWAVFLSNLFAALFVPLFAFYIDRYQIRPEERVLSSLFGAEYASYRSRVRRWL